MSVYVWLPIVVVIVAVVWVSVYYYDRNKKLKRRPVNAPVPINSGTGGTTCVVGPNNNTVIYTIPRQGRTEYVNPYPTHMTQPQPYPQPQQQQQPQQQYVVHDHPPSYDDIVAEGPTPTPNHPAGTAPPNHQQMHGYQK